MHTKTMQKSVVTLGRTANLLLSSVVVLSSIMSCSTESADSPAIVKPGETMGTRTYKLDPGAAGVTVSLSGTAMGTPDTAKFTYLMRMLKNSGEFTTVTEKDPGIAGGMTICGVFSASAGRDAIYEVLRSIETDAKVTNLIATSVSGCTN